MMRDYEAIARDVAGRCARLGDRQGRGAAECGGRAAAAGEEQTRAVDAAHEEHGRAAVAPREERGRAIDEAGEERGRAIDEAGEERARAERMRAVVAAREARMRAVVEACWPALREARVSWLGFYTIDAAGTQMLLGPREPRPACSPIGLHGACGRAFVSRAALLVRDVRELGPNYIACDPRDRSEVVVPVFDAGGDCFGVLDLDSFDLAAFEEGDVAGLERVLAAAGLSR